MIDLSDLAEFQDKQIAGAMERLIKTSPIPCQRLYVSQRHMSAWFGDAYVNIHDTYFYVSVLNHYTRQKIMSVKETSVSQFPTMVHVGKLHLVIKFVAEEKTRHENLKALFVKTVRSV